MDDDGTTYRPDPERENQAVIEAYFSALVRRAGSDEELQTALWARTRARQREHVAWATDPAAERNLRVGAAVLAAHELVGARVAPEELLPLLIAAFVESGASATPRVRAWLDAAGDPFRDMVEVCKAREREAFGPRFAFRRPRDDDQAYLLDVQRCFWHDLFRAAGHPELTAVLCAFDRNWFSAIEPDRHGFRFERPTTLGLGGDHCPFHFYRVRPRSLNGQADG